MDLKLGNLGINYCKQENSNYREILNPAPKVNISMVQDLVAVGGRVQKTEVNDFI